MAKGQGCCAMMTKLYKKDAIWFAVILIIAYVVGFSAGDSISIAIGCPKLITVLIGTVYSAVLLCFAKISGLFSALGLCKIKGEFRQHGYFIPLVLLSCVNLWGGFTLRMGPAETVLFVLSMCFVGLLEEIIFRGFLFGGMAKNHVTSAILVSSLTFGFGHIVNLLLGAPLFDTLLQLVYASAIGFCYTAVFYVSGSLWPCIASHIFVNVTSGFAAETGTVSDLILTAVQTILGVSYGVWLLRQKKKEKSNYDF